jgi:DNA-binding NarL/FixJ family response regulator
MLRRQPGVEVVGEAAGKEEALVAVERLRPDVALVDVRLGRDSGLELCRLLAERAPEVKTVVLTVYEDEQYVLEALRCGARGYLLKKATDEDLARAFEQVMEGEVVVDPSLSGRLALRVARSEKGRNRYGLSARELEVLRGVVDGLSNQKIAERLFIGEETVRTHMKSILRKLGAEDRAHAVSIALREGLLV